MNTRRQALAMVATGVSLAAIHGVALAETGSPSPPPVGEPGQLGDVYIGKPDAKLTIVEYASMTCSHCADFHTKSFPEMRRRYLDTGKARYVLREFPLDPLAVAASMLARSRGDERYYETVDAFFSTQATWAFTSKPYDAIREAAAKAGITGDQFEAVLKDQKLYEGVLSSRERAAKDFGVTSTPTFFLNGTKRVGAISADVMDEVLAPYL